MQILPLPVLLPLVLLPLLPLPLPLLLPPALLKLAAALLAIKSRICPRSGPVTPYTAHRGANP